MTVLEKFTQGDIRALSRLVSFVEDQEEGFRDLLSKLYPKAGRSTRVGVTGPPGAGKSTLVNALAHKFLADGKKVGIVAVDPTSPFTGGALLGDRVRMNEFPTDGSFYFRSMATRGATGGLAAATDNAMILYEAFGFDVTLVETVGVGQVELQIIDSCDTVVVTIVPESGDSVQAMKAGLMEIADIFCVNKADRPGSERIVSELRQTLKIRRQDPDGWKIPVVPTQATMNKGIDDLLGSIEKHIAFAHETGLFERRRREQIKKKIIRILHNRIATLVEDQLPETTNLDALVADIFDGKSDPFSASRELIKLSVDHLKED